MQDGKDRLKLFLSYRASLVRYANRMTGDAHDAEDVVQEAWLRTTTGAAKLPATEMMAYLRMTVRNLALNGIRRKKIESRIFKADGKTETNEIPSDRPDPEADAISRDEYVRIIAALNSLPDNMRIAVEMHRLAGRKLKDIAAHLGVSITTAHSLVLNGIERCRAGTDRGSQ